MSALPQKADIDMGAALRLLVTRRRHSALLTNVVADDATGEAGQDRRQGGPARSVRHLSACRAGFFIFSAIAGKNFPCDGHHSARGCVGLTFHSTSTRICDGNHVAADSPNDDRWRDGVVRDRVGVRGGRVGRRVNPPARRMSTACELGLLNTIV